MKLAAFYPGALFYQLRCCLSVALVSTSGWLQMMDRSECTEYVLRPVYFYCLWGKSAPKCQFQDRRGARASWISKFSSVASQVHYICDCYEAETNILFYLRQVFYFYYYLLQSLKNKQMKDKQSKFGRCVKMQNKDAESMLKA